MADNASLFLDTSLVIAATVEAHPNHGVAAAYEEGEAVLSECLALTKRFEVRGKQVHDCNIVATMRVYGVQALATRNTADFKRHGELIEVISVT